MPVLIFTIRDSPFTSLKWIELVMVRFGIGGSHSSLGFVSNSSASVIPGFLATSTGIVAKRRRRNWRRCFFSFHSYGPGAGGSSFSISMYQ